MPVQSVRRTRVRLLTKSCSSAYDFAVLQGFRVVTYAFTPPGMAESLIASPRLEAIHLTVGPCKEEQCTVQGYDISVAYEPKQWQVDGYRCCQSVTVAPLFALHGTGEVTSGS